MSVLLFYPGVSPHDEIRGWSKAEVGDELYVAVVDEALYQIVVQTGDNPRGVINENPGYLKGRVREWPS